MIRESREPDSEPSLEDDLVIDGLTIRFHPEGVGLRVDCVSGARVGALGTLEPAAKGESYHAVDLSGAPLTRLSPWGGAVTARFQTRELAVRALLDSADRP